MDKVLDILRNKWVKFGVSFLSLVFPVFVFFVDWLAFGYYLEPQNAVPLFLLYVLINFIFGGIMFYTRKQIITCIVVCITPLLAFLLLIIAFGQWYMIIPPVVICLVTFLAAGNNETFKTVLGTIYLLMFVVGTFVYITLLHFNLTVQSLLSITECDLTKRLNDYDYSTDGTYRLVQYADDVSNERRTVSFYVEKTEDDIELPYLKCYKHYGSQKVLVTLLQGEINYNWVSDSELFIDGRVKDIDELFKQAEAAATATEPEGDEETTTRVLTYYETYDGYIGSSANTTTPPVISEEETSEVIE